MNNYNNAGMNLSELSKHWLSIVCLNDKKIEGRSCSKVGLEESDPG